MKVPVIQLNCDADFWQANIFHHDLFKNLIKSLDNFTDLVFVTY